MTIRHLFFLLLYLCSSLLGGAPANAAFPDKPIRLIVPFPPGGAMDSIARAISQPLSRKLGQPVIVDNKAGAGGNVGVDAASKSLADGHTIVIASIGMVTNQYLYSKLAFDPIRDLIPVAQLAVVPNMLVVNPSRIKARTVKSLIAEAQSQPGKLTYASAGNGTSIHLAGELFAAMTGTAILHVPYRGSGPAVNDLLGGQVDMMFDSIASARPHVQAGKLVAIGVTTSKRSPAMADVPTLAESGVVGYNLTPWFGVFMPAGTPGEIVQSMNLALKETLDQSDVKARFFVLGAEPLASTSAAFKSVIDTESKKWEKLIRDRNIRAD